jgi:ribosomal protein S18 acetylase RimI-like enzyme
MNQNIIQINRSQFGQASEILTNAFAADPIVTYFRDRPEKERRELIKWFIKIALHYSYKDGQIYTTQNLDGVAIWIPPEKFPLNDFRLLMLGGYALPFKISPNKLLEFVYLFLQAEKQHKQNVDRQHWYLLMLGVAPDRQSQGIGSLLLQPILERADRAGLSCYLEATTKRSVRFYQKHGFEAIGEIKLLHNNLQVWTMKRNISRKLEKSRSAKV